MKKIAALLIISLLVASMLLAVAPIAAAKVTPDYVAIDIAEAPNYEVLAESAIEPRNHHSYWYVGDVAYWLILDDYAGYYRVRTFQLKAIGTTAEIWSKQTYRGQQETQEHIPQYWTHK